MPPHAIQMLPPDGTGNMGHGREAVLLDADGREVRAPNRQAACCTDCHWCIIFLAALAGFGVMAGLGMKYGNPEVWDRFVAGKDSNGRLCGFDDGVKDFKYTYYTLAVGAGPVNKTSYWTPSTRSNLRIVCTNSCPKANHTATSVPVALRQDTSACPQDMGKWCTWYGAQTFAVVHYCIDPDVFDVEIPWEQWVEDLRAAALHLVAVFPVAIMMGFLFLTVLEKFGAVCVWAILIVVAIIPAGLGIWVYHDAGNTEGTTGEVKSLAKLSPDNEKYVAYALWGFSGAVLLLSCCFAGTVRGIAAVVRCTSHFLKDVSSQMVQPLFFAIMHLIVIAGWLAVFVQVASIGASEGDQQACLAVGDIYCMKWDSSSSQWGIFFCS